MWWDQFSSQLVSPILEEFQIIKNTLAKEMRVDLYVDFVVMFFLIFFSLFDIFCKLLSYFNLCSMRFVWKNNNNMFKY